ncbi:hypothetical protein VTN00DRAFT_2709 [Thermoascus crustaceus]|uniref:uncharacterized protein n=1 Tax=Thermoascus crustaceus TaxID=5088 RepID=UPI003744359C
MAIEIVPLTERDIPGTVECIQQAFAEDPYFLWVFDPSKFNKQRNSDSLTARCLWGINNALFYVAKETSSDTTATTEGEGSSNPASSSSSSSAAQQQVLGVSCWLPPHPASVPETWYSWFQSWLLSFRQLLTNIRYLGHGGLNTRRYWIWKYRQQEAQEAIWNDPRGYYFCNIVAVRPDAQGKGIGRKLFEVVTDQADKEGVKCYLESSKMVPNVEIYRKMGFEVMRAMDCVDGEDSCKLFCMIRDPKQKL